MKLYRIKAIALRYMMLTLRDFHRFIDLIYWPVLDIIIWGFTARWIQTNQAHPLQVSFILLTALIFWQVLFRAQIEVSFSFLDELWSHNLVNLFSTPLKLSEWIIAVMAVGIAKSIFTFFFGTTIVWLLYSLSILKIGLPLLYFFGLIIMSGWAIGFLTTAAIAYWGQKIQTLVWVMTWLFAPFSGVFYPISVLPQWAQLFSRLIPMSYLFESIRELIITGIVPKNMLLICFGLNIFYLALGIMFFKVAFEKSKIYGLARLERYE
jgi:ABC-2 type transport system permease protein